MKRCIVLVVALALGFGATGTPARASLTSLLKHLAASTSGKHAASTPAKNGQSTFWKAGASGGKMAPKKVPQKNGSATFWKAGAQGLHTPPPRPRPKK